MRQTTYGVIDLTGLSLSGKGLIELHLSDIVVNTDDASLGMKVYIDGSISTNTYRIYRNSIESASTTNVTESTDANAYFALTDTAANWGVGSAAAEGFSAVIMLHNPTQAKYKYLTSDSAWASPDDDAIYSDSIMVLNDTGSITGFYIYSPSGAQITSGTASVRSITL